MPKRHSAVNDETEEGGQDKPISDDGNSRGYWWKAPSGEVHKEVFTLADAMEEEQRRRRTRNAFFTALFGDRDDRYDVVGDGYDMRPTWNEWGSLSYNLIRGAVEALAAKISKNKPKATFLTDGGTWSQQRRAARLDRWVYGVFHSTNLYRKAQEAFHDGTVRDLGVLKAYVADGRICFEKVDPDEVKVGAMDGRAKEPRTLLHTRTVSREVVRGMIEDWHGPESDDPWDAKRLSDALEMVEIAKRSSHPEKHFENLAQLGDVVEVQEIWRLPSYPGAEDGRHAICIENLTILDEEWNLSRFPFVFFRFAHRRRGFYAQGVAELLAPRQRAINSILRNIEDTARLMSVARYFVRSGSKINIKKLTNEPGIILEGMEPPQVLTGNVIPPELFTMYKSAIAEGYESVGISQMSVAAKKPAGLNSGAALREYNDTESERFALVHQEWEAFFEDCAHLSIALARVADEAGEPIDVQVPRARYTERIKWQEVSLDEDAFVLKIFSSSSLPTQPAARRQAVRELFDDGAIDALDYRRLLDMPDLVAASDVVTAARDDIDALVERFLDAPEGEEAEAYEPPEPFQDLKYGIKRMQSEYLRARAVKAPEEVLELFRRWMEQARFMVRRMEAEAARDAAQAGAPPAAAPAGQAPVAAA
jgi:hypothetical protein